MKKQVALILIVSVILSACNGGSNKNSIPETGSIDSTAIAQDTSMQTAIESSYEYHKTLNASEKLVYDIIAYGGSATKGQYAIIRRGFDNKPDTIAQGERKGIIVNTFLADLNKNSDEDIYIILQSADSNKNHGVIVYEIDKLGRADPLSSPISLNCDSNNGYKGMDSIYIDGKFLIWKYPQFYKNELNGWMNNKYVLHKNNFSELQDHDMVIF